MPLQKHLQTQNTKTINFSMMNSVPTTEDLKYALTTAQQNRKPVELPFKNPNNQILFIVRVVPGQGEVKPRWTLERHQHGGQDMLWTQETDHLIMIQGKIKLDTSYTRNTDTSESAPIVLSAGGPSTAAYPAMPQSSSGGFVLQPESTAPADEALPTPGFLRGDPYNLEDPSEPPTFTVYQAPPEDVAASPQQSSSGTNTLTLPVVSAPTPAEPGQSELKTQARALNSTSSQKLQALITTRPAEPADTGASEPGTPGSVCAGEPPPTPGFLLGDPYNTRTPENVQFTVFQAKDKPVLPAPVIFDDDLIKSVENKLVNSVTGLADYPAFAYLLIKECERYQKVATPISVVTFDIANGEIKRGQELPLEVFGPLVRRVKTLCTSTDVIGYLGRGELAIMLWNTDLAAGLSFSRSLYMTLSESPILSCASEETESVSIGVASIPQTCLDAGTLLAAAKKAKETARASNCPYMAFS